MFMARRFVFFQCLAVVDPDVRPEAAVLVTDPFLATVEARYSPREPTPALPPHLQGLLY